MKVTIIPDSIKEDRRTVSCEVKFVLDTDGFKAKLRGVLNVSFDDATSVNIYKRLMERESKSPEGKGGD